MQVIDTHAQLWTAEAIMSMPEAMRENYVRVFANNLPSIEDTISDMDAAGVSTSVIVAVDAEVQWGYRVSNELGAEKERKKPDRLIGFASVDPNKGEAARKELRRAVSEKDMRGLKLVPHLCERQVNEPGMDPQEDCVLYTGPQQGRGRAQGAAPRRERERHARAQAGPAPLRDPGQRAGDVPAVRGGPGARHTGAVPHGNPVP